MSINFLQNKKIAILGLGIENQALIKYLLKHKVKGEITICDARIEIKNKLPALWQLGKNFNKGLGKFDILFRSPGWPIDCPGIKQAVRAGAELSSPIKLFFDLSPSKNIIGVTGTKGKGTTASLIYGILKQVGKKVWLGGNIGVAPFAFIDKIKGKDWIVLELSSFQLEDMTVSPAIAVVTNLYSEHLAPADPNNPNYHKTLADYWGAKWNIAKYQKRGDWVILNSKSQILNFKQAPNPKSEILKQVESKVIYFKKSELPSKLTGEHNKENVAAAVAVAKIVGVKPEAIKKAVADFKGLPHRLELAREYKGVKYYDDSFATAPESTIIALKSFSAPVILLLGGADKGAVFGGLAKEVKRRVKFIVLLAGQATNRIKQALLEVGYENDKMKMADNIGEAVKLAKAEAQSSEVVLLSTACASFGMFKNYKERGNLFKREVLKLK